MTKISLLIVFSLMLNCSMAINITSSKASNKLVNYVDGNGNKYIIALQKVDAIIEYVPMDKKNSSSGEYSGGEPFKITITVEDHKSLMELFKAAAKDESQQCIDRNMGTGAIIYPKGRMYFLKMDSYNKSAIEKRLKDLKAKYWKVDIVPSSDTLIVEGIFIEKSFESKKGVMTDIKEFYFLPTKTEIVDKKLAEEYFVKLSKGKVSKENIKEFMGRPIRARLVPMKGLWDADDNTHQSRFGDYVIVVELID